MRVGIIVNPIAGMGGRVGLKGTDGKVEEARERGAIPRAPERARRALKTLREIMADVEIVAPPGELGAYPATDAGFTPTVVGNIAPEATEDPAETTSEDTRAMVRELVNHDVDIVLFVGGDGTAIDVAEVLDDAGVKTPMLGVPAGVKVYSSVFAVSPEQAGQVLANYDRVEEREINDIDEDAYREGEVRAELKAVRPVPVGEGLQSSKQIGGGTVAAIADGIVADVTPGTTYVLGPGGTLQEIKSALGIEGSPLGVDVWRADQDGGTLLVKDGSEKEILNALGETNKVIVSPIGGQGFVFGRGNHQISPAVIEESEVEIVASKDKLDEIDVLRVDLDSPAVEEKVRGWHKVRIGRVERRMMKVE